MHPWWNHDAGSRSSRCRRRLWGRLHRAPRLALCGEPRSRGAQPAPPARPGRDGPLLRLTARRVRRGCGGAHLPGPLQPLLPLRVRRDAPSLPAAAARRALDVSAARDPPNCHRRVPRGRVHQPRNLQPDLSGDRRRDPKRLSGRARPGRGAALRAARRHATTEQRCLAGTIEQFWRSRRRPRSLGSTRPPETHRRPR